MTISMKELIGPTDLASLPSDIQNNLKHLLDVINKIRDAYGNPLTVTSGLRTMAHHIEIYKQKALKAGVPFDQSKVPMQSKHLYGEAVDISDPHGQLKKWCISNLELLEKLGIWMEEFDSTPNWVHFQIVPYGSWKEGKSRWFKP